MKVFNIGTSEVSIIRDALDQYKQAYEKDYNNETNPKIKANMEYELAHIRTTNKLLYDERLQELCERCMSYFVDRLFDGGAEEWPEIEFLEDDMGINEEELKSLFIEAGFEQ